MGKGCQGEDEGPPARLYRLTRPLASPAARRSTSDTLTRLKSPGIVCLRALAATANSPVGVPSDLSGSEQDRTAAERLGAEAYFQKPADLTAYMSLGQLIRRVLDSSGERRGTG